MGRAPRAYQLDRRGRVGGCARGRACSRARSAAGWLADGFARRQKIHAPYSVASGPYLSLAVIGSRAGGLARTPLRARERRAAQRPAGRRFIASAGGARAGCLWVVTGAGALRLTIGLGSIRRDATRLGAVRAALPARLVSALCGALLHSVRAFTVRVRARCARHKKRAQARWARPCPTSTAANSTPANGKWRKDCKFRHSLSLVERSQHDDGESGGAHSHSLRSLSTALSTAHTKRPFVWEYQGSSECACTPCAASRPAQASDDDERASERFSRLHANFGSQSYTRKRSERIAAKPALLSVVWPASQPAS